MNKFIIMLLALNFLTPSFSFSGGYQTPRDTRAYLNSPYANMAREMRIAYFNHKNAGKGGYPRPDRKKYSDYELYHYDTARYLKALKVPMENTEHLIILFAWQDIKTGVVLAYFKFTRNGVLAEGFAPLVPGLRYSPDLKKLGTEGANRAEELLLTLIYLQNKGIVIGNGRVHKLKTGKEGALGSLLYHDIFDSTEAGVVMDAVPIFLGTARHAYKTALQTHDAAKHFKHWKPW